tara:strand:+ start:44418 stop:45623 length:1206 start_codon:yes stop_codon:yes gene_type:complete
MKSKLLHSTWILMLTLCVVISCSEEEGPQPLEVNASAPGQVENVKVENLPGKVKLSYTLPNNQDLLYIVARYTLENGTPMEVKSSYYNSSMLLEGFAGQSEREVEIYAVNRSEAESNPVQIKVNPLEAPIFDVFKSLEVQADFGGLRITADNPNLENLAILVMQKNVENDWEPLPTSIYTATDEIKKSLRGFDTISQNFALTIRDRWLNVTDTLYTEIKPLFETIMPKSDFVGVNLSNDAEVICCYPVSNLWDGEFLQYWGSYFTSRTIDTKDHLVTFDIGKKTKLSRLKIWQFSEPIGGQRLYYYLGAMKTFRIWGSNELNDGDLSGWTLLGDFEVKKPSGLPYAQETNEDLLAAQDGADYEISFDMPAVRYLRIQCLDNWAGGDFMAVSEVQVYGNPNF